MRFYRPATRDLLASFVSCCVMLALAHLVAWLLAGCSGDAFEATQTGIALLPNDHDSSAPAGDAGSKHDAHRAPDSSGTADAADATDADAARDATPCESVEHSDGLGQEWTDCTPAGTYDADEAEAACAAFAAAATDAGGHCSTPETCSSSSALVVVYLYNNGNNCMAAWAIPGTDDAGAGIGHVTPPGVGCLCPTSSDPAWD